MFGGKTKIVGIGSALVDLLCRESDAFVEALGVDKGGMTLVENEVIDQALAKASQPPQVVSGGAACNTIVGIGQLGGQAAFVGKSGQDEFASKFVADLEKSGVETLLASSASPTGRVLSIITPDAQRTMLTNLGASTELDPVSITAASFRECAVVVVEGYLLFNPGLMLATVKAAKAAGAWVFLDLASFEVVNNTKELLEEIVADYVDILIANEDEAAAYTDQTDETEALKILSKDVTMAVLKVGQRGSYISYQGETITISPQVGGPAVDTTGAGDLWAAGFLYGLVNGYPLEKCGAIGSACGYEVCQVIGAKIPEAGWAKIKTIL